MNADQKKKKSLPVGCFCIRSSATVAIWMREESEVHLDAAIEVNEIHTPVSRSFVRPKATSPSLPACLFRVLLESVEHQGDENTPHPVYATAHIRILCCEHASMALGVPFDSL